MQESSQYQYPTLQVPKDEQGYVQSFSVEQEQEFFDFFNKYGLVVCCCHTKAYTSMISNIIIIIRL
jgi:hypothetical protein